MASREGCLDWRSKLFSIFVGNLDLSTSLGVLWKVFSSFGVVVDAYIPSSSKRRQFKYAFVRFKSDVEATRAIEGGTNLVIDGRKAIVDKAVPSCSKNFSFRTAHGRKDGTSGFLKRSYKEVVSSSLDRPSVSEEVQNCADGLVEKNNLSEKVKVKENFNKTLHFGDEVNGWLERSAVGTLRSPIDSSVIREGLIREGVQVSLSPLSNASTLIVFGSIEDREHLLLHYLSIFSLWFDRIVPWGQPDSDFFAKHYWVKVVNTPLILWHDKFFHALGEEWGKVIRIAEVTSRKDLLYAAWFCLEIDCIESIPKFFEGKVNGIDFNVEVSIVSADSIPKPWSEYALSDSSSDHNTADSPVYVLEALQDIDEGQPNSNLVVTTPDECQHLEDVNMSMVNEDDLQVGSFDRDSLVNDQCLSFEAFNQQSPNELTACQDENTTVLGVDLIVDFSQIANIDKAEKVDSHFLPAANLNINGDIGARKNHVGFGGFCSGFLDVDSKANWSWIKRPRMRRPVSVYSSVEANKGEAAHSDRVSLSELRKEAEATFNVGKELGLTFQEEDEMVLQALMEAERDYLDDSSGM